MLPLKSQNRRSKNNPPFLFYFFPMLEIVVSSDVFPPRSHLRKKRCIAGHFFSFTFYYAPCATAWKEERGGGNHWTKGERRLLQHHVRREGGGRSALSSRYGICRWSLPSKHSKTTCIKKYCLDVVFLNISDAW